MMRDINIVAMTIKDIIDDLPHNGKFKGRPLKAITSIIIHHSDSPIGQFSPVDFANWHINGKMKAPRICYHYVIEKDGTVYQTNLLESITWHAGNFNYSSIGILVNGAFEEDEPTDEQLNSLKILNYYLQERFNNKLSIYGHRDVQPTLCPGKNLYARKDEWQYPVYDRPLNER